MNSTLVNATPVAVAFRDNRPSETLTLKQLSIRDLYRWIELFAARNTPALVALALGQPVEFVDQLTDESFGAIAQESFRINFPRATALSLKDVTVAALISPHLLAIANLSDGQPSPAKSPAPAASESAVATGSA